MSTQLERLIATTKGVRLTPEQSEEQRRSFAYGNTKIENPRITRKTVDQEAESLKQNRK